MEDADGVPRSTQSTSKGGLGYRGRGESAPKSLSSPAWHLRDCGGEQIRDRVLATEHNAARHVGLVAAAIATVHPTTWSKK